MMGRICIIFTLFISFFSVAGCVHEAKYPLPSNEDDARLSIAQNSDGLVTVSWVSKIGYVYRLYVMDENLTWKRVDDVADFRGTGKTISFTKQLSPYAKIPVYSVRGIKITHNWH